MRISDWSSDVCSSDLDQVRGTYVIVVTEIPYQVQKSKLVEQIAGLINDRKLPILADVRDESDAELRLVLEPRARTVEGEVLMESLFKLNELETRFGLNLHGLDKDRRPRVMSLAAARKAGVGTQLERGRAHDGSPVING